MIQNNKKNYTDYRMTTDGKVVDTILHPEPRSLETFSFNIACFDLF